MDTPSLRIHSIETFGTHEGPGIRLVLFLQGCQFRCLYCHNPDTWNLNGGSETSIDSIIERTLKEKEYFTNGGGVTVSGGEPLIQRQALIPLFFQLQKRGIHTALDTNGSLFDATTRDLLKHTDLVILDVKHINDEWHTKLTGTSNRSTLSFAKYCENAGIPLWLRYVLVPGYTDQEEYIHEWGKTFQDYETIKRVEILPYHTLGIYKYEKMGIPYRLEGIQPPTEKSIKSTKRIFSQYFKDVYVR